MIVGGVSWYYPHAQNVTLLKSKLTLYAETQCGTTAPCSPQQSNGFSLSVISERKSKYTEQILEGWSEWGGGGVYTGFLQYNKISYQ